MLIKEASKLSREWNEAEAMRPNHCSKPTVWPDDEIKSSPISPNIAQKVAKSFLNESCIIYNSPKIYQNIWANCVRKFVTKNIKNSLIWSHCKPTRRDWGIEWNVNGIIKTRDSHFRESDVRMMNLILRGRIDQRKRRRKLYSDLV